MPQSPIEPAERGFRSSNVEVSMRVRRSAALAAATCFAIALAASVAAAEKLAADAPAAMSPKVAGARYGQALGSSLVCPYVRLMPAAEDLMRRYSGEALETFKAEAQQIALIWKKTLGCDPMADINRCRVLSEKSCSEAIKEIGPAGTAATGLIEFRK